MPAYFWAVWLPLVFVNVYMLVWIVLRQTMMIANIQRLLRLFAVEPVPFHPDRCSGFAPIGGYATDIVRVALGTARVCGNNSYGGLRLVHPSAERQLTVLITRSIGSPLLHLGIHPV